MKSIKIYGERNSGTNYLEALVKKNLDVQLLRYVPSPRIGKILKYEFMSGWAFELNKKKFLGWKHGIPKTKEINTYNCSPLLIITVTKNPYSFLLSLNKRPYHYRGDRKKSFISFLKNEWPSILRDNYEKTYFSTPVDLWNIKNKAYLRLKQQSNKRVIHITYEELVSNPGEIIGIIAKEMKLPIKGTGQFSNILTSTKGDKQSFDDYKEYYQNEKWKNELQEEELKFINEHLDYEVMSSFGYEKIASIND